MLYRILKGRSAQSNGGYDMRFMPAWAQKYMLFVGLPAFVIFVAAFIFSEDPFANPLLVVGPFLVFASACAIRAYFMLHAMGRGER